MNLQGPDLSDSLSDSRDPIFFDSGDPMMIFSHSTDPIFNSKDPKHLKNPGLYDVYNNRAVMGKGKKAARKANRSQAQQNVQA